METRITRRELFGVPIWTVRYYSQFSKCWVVSGTFDSHTEAIADARSWG